MMVCRNACLLSGLLLAMAAEARAQETGEPTKLVLRVGEHQFIERAGVEALVVGEGPVISVRRVGQGFAVSALAPGRQSFTLRLRGGRTETWLVEVHPDPRTEIRQLVNDLLGPEAGGQVSLDVAGGKLVLKGRITSLEVWQRVRRVLEAFAEIVDLTETEARVLDELAALINKQLRAAGLPGARVERIGSKLFLEGNVSDELARRKARAIVEELYGQAWGGR